MVTFGVLVFIFLNIFPIIIEAGPSPSCNLINHFILPQTPPLKAKSQSGFCSGQSEINCCTNEVEQQLKAKLKDTSHSRVFDKVLMWRDIVYPEYLEFEQMRIHFLSDDLQRSALQFSILDGINTNRHDLMEDATNNYLNTFVEIETIPEYCKNEVIPKLQTHLYRYFEEIVFAKKFISKNWKIVNEIFRLIRSTELSSSCLHGLLRAGLADASCKMCRDDTINVPTCYNLCADVMSECMAPFLGLRPVFDSWLATYRKVLIKVFPYISKERFDKLLTELRTIILENELKNVHFADVCSYHFQSIKKGNGEGSPYTHGKHRRKRLDKPGLMSTRSLTSPPTTSPTDVSSTMGGTDSKLVFVTGSLPSANSSMDPSVTCTDLLAEHALESCWNGTSIGQYSPSEHSSSSEKTPDFTDSIAQLNTQLNDLSELLKRDISRVSPTESNELANNTPNSHSTDIKYSSVFLLLNIVFPLKILSYVF